MLQKWRQCRGFPTWDWDRLHISGLAQSWISWVMIMVMFIVHRCLLRSQTVIFNFYLYFIYYMFIYKYIFTFFQEKSPEESELRACDDVLV